MERHRKFLEAWFAFDTLDDIARHLGEDRRWVSNMAAGMRRNGVVLPARVGRSRCNRYGDLINWTELQILAAELADQAERRRAMEESARAAERYRRGA